MSGAAAGAAVVERFLSAMRAHEWDAMGACVTPDVVRVGPHGDTYKGREDYVSFIASLLPTLPGYAMEISRIVESGSVVTVQLAETVDVDGAPLRTPEALVFDIGDTGLIARIEVFTQTGSRG